MQIPFNVNLNELIAASVVGVTKFIKNTSDFTYVSLAEWSKAVALGAIPKGQGFKSLS